VSQACTDYCRHMDNALVHAVGDVAALSSHLRLLHEDRALLRALRASGLALAPTITWTAAGAKLDQVYAETIAAFRRSAGRPAMGDAAGPLDGAARGVAI
jgi:hypothetical protein